MRKWTNSATEDGWSEKNSGVKNVNADNYDDGDDEMEGLWKDGKGKKACEYDMQKRKAKKKSRSDIMEMTKVERERHLVTVTLLLKLMLRCTMRM